MGYTHYWKTLTKPGNIEWTELRERVHAILGANLTVPLRWESDIDDPPEMSGNLLRFNGVGDMGYETFYLVRDKIEFGFCKTARKPYDEVVVAVLMAAADTLAGFSWSSDGEGEDHDAGRALYAKAVRGKAPDTEGAPTMRYAVCNTMGDGVDEKEVRSYMPTNFTVIGSNDQHVFIQGFDRAGWTMGGYVIPRLSSGMIWAMEVSVGTMLDLTLNGGKMRPGYSEPTNPEVGS